MISLTSEHALKPSNNPDNLPLPLLSICIPTYNRAELVSALVSSILSVPGAFELCVHIDGSSDQTSTLLNSVSDRRLSVSEGINLGRARALAYACARARGKFTMIFDDDDVLYIDGLRTILSDLESPLAADCIGYIYHMHHPQGMEVGAEFPRDQNTNFLNLRADYRVAGDKKEVVLTSELQQVLWPAHLSYRRVPTSLAWSRLALRFDVICRHVVIGRKRYYADGMTAVIGKLKRSNPEPMTQLYWTHLKGFALQRYRSPRFLARAAGGLVAYSLRRIGGTPSRLK